jgi:hypothetical protein
MPLQPVMCSMLIANAYKLEFIDLFTAWQQFYEARDVTDGRPSLHQPRQHASLDTAWHRVQLLWRRNRHA